MSLLLKKFSLFNDASGGSVVMTGEAIEFGTLSAGGATRAGIRFNSDGSIDEQGPGALDFTQIDAGEWWSLEPSVAVGAGYDVRFLSSGKSGTWTVSAAADDAWINLASDQTWNVFVAAKGSPSSKTCGGTFEIRVASTGSAVASAAYSCTANN